MRPSRRERRRESRCLSPARSPSAASSGILSSQQEVGTITLGSPYSTVRVSEDGEAKIERCVMEKVHFAYNALKLDEISGNEVMSAFKSFMENPEFLME